MNLNFEDLTIKQLRNLTEQYEKILKENKLLKIKYPNKSKKEKKEQTTQEMIDSLPK